MSAAGVGLAGGIGFGMVGKIMGGVAQKKAAKQEALNIKAQGKLTKAEAYQGARQMRKAHAHAKANMVVGSLKSGVTGGTELDVLAQVAGEFELEAESKERFGRNAWELAKTGAAAAEQAGKFALAGSVLGAAGMGASGYATGKLVKAW